MATTEKKAVKPSHYPPYQRKGTRRTAPARATSAYAAQCFPSPVPSRWEQRGFLAKKPKTKEPMYKRLERCLKWLKEDFKLVFVPREQIEDPDDMESLGVTQAVISDFTVDSWIFSIFSGVSSLPFISYPFNSKDLLSSIAEGPEKERFKAALEGISNYFYGAKREMKKRVENDAYFLNSQFRSHTIWFLEKFFSSDLVQPEAVDDTNVEFEVIMPPPLPEEVKNAISN